MNLGTFAVGDVPVGITFDGAHIWVANQLSNTVTKLNALEVKDSLIIPIRQHT